VLAGGRSSRMGTPKAALEWHGSTLLRRTVGIVARATGGPVVVVRAAGQDSVLASQGGIHVRRMYIGAWVIGGVLAAIAGILYGSTSIVDSSMSGLGLIAIPALVLGGLDSFEGAVAGGLIVGIVQGFITVYLGGQWVNPVTYTLLLVVLLVLPRGLFGTQEVLKV